MSNPTEQKNQLEIIRDILKTHIHLPKMGSYNISLKRGATKIFEKLSKTYTIVEEQRGFSECFSGETFDSFESKKERLFVLREIRRESHILPLIGLRYKIGEESLSISLRAGLFQNSEKQVVAFGYRFESPSRMDFEDSEKNKDKAKLKIAVTDSVSTKKISVNVGSHDFYHAQPIRTFKKNDSRYRLPCCPIWFTEKQPSFPLDAKCPVTLVLAFLIGIYGMECWKTIQSDRHLFSKVKEISKGLHFAMSNNLN